MRVLAALTLLSLAACGANASGRDADDSASGSATSRTFQATDFTRVAAAGSDKVVVTVGPAFSIRAEGPAKVLDLLDIRREGDTLRVGRKRQGGFSWSSDDQGATVHVTMPAIAAAHLAGSGDLSIDRATGDTFEGAVAGSGDLSIAALTSRQVKLSIAGSGDIAATGAVGGADLSVAGSGDISAGALKVARASVSIAGSGSVKADVDGPATVSIVGSGDAELGRNARCNVNARGSGEAHCG